MKTLIQPDGEGESAKKVLLGVEEHFNGAAEEFKAAVRKLQSGEIVEPSKARDLVGEYKKLVTLLYRERQSLEDERRRESRVHGEYGLDLGEARHEIGRRMDRLRAAGTAAGVSDRSG